MFHIRKIKIRDFVFCAPGLTNHKHCAMLPLCMCVLWCGTIHVWFPDRSNIYCFQKGVNDMFVRPEAEVVLFAEELFIEMSGETVTTSDNRAPIELPDL